MKPLASTAKRHELDGVRFVRVIEQLPQQRLRPLYGLTGTLVKVRGTKAVVNFGGSVQQSLPLTAVQPVASYQ